VRKETAGFKKAAGEYARGRPDYPVDATSWIIGRAGLRPGRTVVDLAAGTGKLTKELVKSGARVVAVEPLDEMRAELQQLLPEVEAYSGTAEKTGLEDALADAVTVAQAFHWFANDEALSEIARVLRHDGLLFLIWNRRDLSDPLQEEISRLTLPHVGEVPSYTTGAWEKVMAASALFVADDEHHSRHSQLVDRQRLVDRVASTSYIANLDESRRQDLLSEVAELLGESEEAELPYATDVYCYRRL
jgi:SAM-dependent methyltransferase